MAIPLLSITILTSLITIIGCTLGKSSQWGYYPAMVWSRLMCYLMLLPVKVRGREQLQKKQSYVFVANHQGAFDIFLIYGFLGRNFKWMMKKGLRKTPFIGRACEKAEHIFVDRSGPRKVYQTIIKARKTLTNGMSLVIFPEGARTFTGHMGYFKRGAFQLADQLQLPVVPMTINGSFQVLPRSKKKITWSPLELTIHQPLYPQGKGDKNIDFLLDSCYKTIESALPDDLKGMVYNEDQDVIN
jgi:1-acyl-sn-glycerol-3-phosphate acyltransferase